MAEQELSLPEQRYRLLADNVKDVIWTMDTAGHFTYVSPSILQLRGYTPEEVRAQSLEQALAPESAKRVYDFIGQGLEALKVPAGSRRAPGRWSSRRRTAAPSGRR